MTKQISKEVSISMEAAKRHSKRMLKVLNKEYNITSKVNNAPIALHDTQEIFAKTIGCNNWHEFSELSKQNQTNSINIFNDLEDSEIANIIMAIKGGEKSDIWNMRADSLILALIPTLVELRDKNEIVLDINAMIYYLNLDNIDKLLKKRNVSEFNHFNIKTYLNSLSGYNENSPKQTETTIEQHGYLKMQILPVLTLLKQISEKEIVLYNKKWDILLANQEQLVKSPYNLTLLQQKEIQKIKNNFKYENEVWFDKMQDKINYPIIHDVYLKTDKVLMLNDLILNLFNLNIYDHEIHFIIKLIKNHQRVNKISNEIENIYLKVKNIIG